MSFSCNAKIELITIIILIYTTQQMFWQLKPCVNKALIVIEVNISLPTSSSLVDSLTIPGLSTGDKHNTQRVDNPVLMLG